MAREFIIYADESVTKGAKFSNFYGGCIVTSTDAPGVSARLDERKRSLNLFGEVKWERVTGPYLDKYVQVVNAFFDELDSGTVRFRVMFTQNTRLKRKLTPEQQEQSYFILYYYFIRYAFGFQHADQPGRVRINFDELPDTLERREKFRGYLSALSRLPEFRRAGIFIDPHQVAEVKSHEHVILQCCDIVLGAIQFRLNEKHKDKPPGASRRGKRTRAKEDLYKVILRRITKLRNHFNIGMTTGSDGDKANRWRHPYRHWLFVPQDRA